MRVRVVLVPVELLALALDEVPDEVLVEVLVEEVALFPPVAPASYGEPGNASEQAVSAPHTSAAAHRAGVARRPLVVRRFIRHIAEAAREHVRRATSVGCSVRQSNGHREDHV